jgi:hypothetical protein
MRHLRLPLLLVLFALPDAAALAAQTNEASSTPISFSPPRAVGAYSLRNQRVLGPGEGAHLRYEREAEEGWIDVYVYPTPQDSSCTGGCDTLAVKRESDEFASIIPELLRRGYYQKLRVAADEHVAFSAAGGGHARHLRLEGVMEGRNVTSQFYLFPAGNLLLKVRATYAPSVTHDSAVQRFAQNFVEEGFSGGMACRNGPPHAENVSKSTELALPPARLRMRVDSVLRVLGYEWDAGEGEASAWQTRPLRAWPDRTEWGMMRDKPFPGMVLRLAIEPAGSASKLTVMADLMCGMEQRDLENAVGLIAAMEVVSAFSKESK